MLRTLQGIALAGLPAVAMAYLAEEIHGSSLGLSIGLYIGGNAIGGMSGRLLSGVFADTGGWRLAFAGVGGLALLCALTSIKLLPASAHFHPRPFKPARLVRGMRVHLTEPGLLRLDAVGALLMATFAAVYNGLTFRLEDAPYGLSHAAVAAIFLVYPIGSFSSAWAGRLADRDRPPAGAAAGDRARRRRAGADRRLLAAADRARRRDADGRLLRRPLGRLLVGRPPRQSLGRLGGAGVGALPVRLLRRLARSVASPPGPPGAAATGRR